MKAILPILICSAISAGLGYYFGHITVPAEEETPATAAVTKTPTPAPTYQPAPVEEAPQPEPTSISPAETVTEPPAVVEAPSSTDAAFAERANLPIQTLTDTQGRTMQANILEVTASDVKIRRSDGLETTIPLNMLSADDVAFCNYLKEQKSTQKQSSPAIKEDDFDWDAYFNS